MKSTLNKIRYLLTLVTIVTIVQLGDTRTMKGKNSYFSKIFNKIKKKLLNKIVQLIFCKL